MRLKPIVFIFSDWFYPASNAGGPIQSVQNLVNAIRNYFQIYVYTSAYDINSSDKLQGIISDRWHLTKDYFLYYSTRNQSMLELQKQIFEIKPNVIYLNSMFSKTYSIHVLWSLVKSNYSGKIILAPRGMLKESAIKRKFLKKYIYLKLAEAFGWYNTVTFHATNKQEEKEILSYFPKAKIYVIDNLSPDLCPQLQSIHKEKGLMKLVFVGRVHPIKNLKLIFECLLYVSVKIEINIIGNIEENKYYQQLKHLESMLKENIQVNYVGPLLHSKIANSILGSHLFVLPTLGENYGHAIIEALSVGRPVLISDKTPWKNLKDYNAGWELTLSDKQAWINAIEIAASWDQDEFDKHCVGALTYAKAHSNNKELVKMYIEMFSGTETTQKR